MAVELELKSYRYLRVVSEFRPFFLCGAAVTDKLSHSGVVLQTRDMRALRSSSILVQASSDIDQLH